MMPTKQKPADPIFAAIDAHKAITRQLLRIENKLDKAGDLVGIASLRKQLDADQKAIMRVAKTRPTTLAGVGALVAYVRRDMMGPRPDWKEIALKTVAGALAKMRIAKERI
jgi:hypothetical protein